jgi:hypothetical protein
MIANTLVVLATAALAAASPSRRSEKSSSCGVEAILPKNGDFPELPAPKGLRLKKIALGYGIQNYTCSGKDAEPTATGAVAALFDMTPFYPDPSDPHSLSLEEYHQLTAVVIDSAPLNFPLNAIDPVKGRNPQADPGADPKNPFKDVKSLPIPGFEGLELAHAGEHFFTDKGVPAFKLDEGLAIECAKLDASDAPVGSARGAHGEAAVAWLRLGPKEGSKVTKGLEMVYRVKTASGSPHSCKDGGENDTTFYAAEYWFFG